MFLSANRKNSFLICRLLFKQPKKSLKNISFIPQIYRKSLLCKSKYELVYDFPLINFPAAFARSRYSVSITAIVVAPFLLLFSTKISVVILLASAGVHYAICSATSKFSQNIVGKIYVNKESDFQDLIISSLDKFGRRIDRNHKLNDFINCDYYSKLSMYLGFIRIAIENSDVHYKINIRNCKIYNSEICNHLFGRLWIEKTEKYEK